MTIVGQQYSTHQHDPPAPVCHVTLSVTPGKQPTAELQMLMDTGSDCTCIPPINKLGAVANELSVSGAEVISGVGWSRLARKYYVWLSLCGLNPVSVEALEFKEYTVLGRDVLNRYKLTLDGPGGRWSIQ